MKKFCFAMLIVLLATVGSSLAASRGYNSVVSDSGNLGTNAFTRWWDATRTSGTEISPNGQVLCGPFTGPAYAGWDSVTRTCQLKYNTLATVLGYRSPNGDITNATDSGGAEGNLHYIVFDFETPDHDGDATPSRVGYYFFAARTVSTSPTDANSNLVGANCAGTNAQTCLARADAASGITITNSRWGDLLSKGGWRPIPVAVVENADKSNPANGLINLRWQPARAYSNVGNPYVPANIEGPVAYKLYGVRKTACTEPTDADFAAAERVYDLPSVPLSTNIINFQVQTNDFTCPANAGNPAPHPCTAHTPSSNPLADPSCYYFAIKLVYPYPGGAAQLSKFFSASSPGVVFGGLATQVYDLQAVIERAKFDHVTWKTSLEEGTQYFVVERAYSANGPWMAASGPIQAKGEPSSYEFVDRIPARAKDIFNRLRIVDTDNNASYSDTVKAVKK